MEVRRDGSARRSDNESNGWTDLTSEQRYLAPDDGNAADRTVMAVTLPFAVQPEETLDIEVEWTGKIPRPFARTGYVDDYYFIAQWFPKIGVLEDAGWNTHQFHSHTEFYSDYGVYDVRITAPREFVVGATGCRPPRDAQIRRPPAATATAAATAMDYPRTHTGIGPPMSTTSRGRRVRSSST